MSKQLLMGNQAIALGAIRAGVGVAAGYPGTPSTEIIETIAKNNPGDIHVEWSVNEKAAMELAAGAAYSGVRTIVTMKQVGLNVASDPLMSLAYVGVKGGMVVVSADDPGPISSQTEQDTRTFAAFAKLPVFDPVSPEEAYKMIGDAFELSEKYGTPVLLRPTTRVCHGCSVVDVLEREKEPAKGCFERSPSWVIFPRLSYQNHIKLERRRAALSKEFSGNGYSGNGYSGNGYNTVIGEGSLGIAAGGAAYGYALEALGILGLSAEKDVKLLKIANAYPFPEELAEEFLRSADRVIVFEELDPVIENGLITVCGKKHIDTEISGKLDGKTPEAGELSADICARVLAGYAGKDIGSAPEREPLPDMAVRPPVLCAGCPHRGSFYAVKRALKGQKAVFSGDIGCYTLGNAMPLDMVDTCLCMGAGVTMAQGIHTVQPDTKNIAFIGDSTFFASGMTGIVNALYNQHDITVIVLDNSTTAMTGHQPHPGTGRTVMGAETFAQKIPDVLRGLGVRCVLECDPLDLGEAVKTVKEAVAFEGVSAVVFRSPCVALFRPEKTVKVDGAKCVGCLACIRELGCPAISLSDGKALISPSMCAGCGLCTQVCPCDAISESAAGVKEG